MFHVKRPPPEHKREWTADSLYAYGLRFLTYRARSEREVRQRFQQRAAPPDLAEAVLDRLKTGGLIDDRAFAQAWVDSRRRASPRGQRLLQRELSQKGIARDTADAVLEGESHEAAQALAAATKKARALAGEPQAVFLRRLTDFLLRRGFDYEIATACVRQLATGHEADEGDRDEAPRLSP